MRKAWSPCFSFRFDMFDPTILAFRSDRWSCSSEFEVEFSVEKVIVCARDACEGKRDRLTKPERFHVKHFCNPFTR
jgi:hypothetical protein